MASSVRLGNTRGEVVLHARLFDGLQPGVLVAESVWPNAEFEGGIGINALTSDDPGPPAGGAVFHDTAVWLRAAWQCRWRLNNDSLAPPLRERECADPSPASGGGGGVQRKETA